MADRAAMTESRYRSFVAMALLAQADGDPEGAVGLLDQAEQLYRPVFFPDVRPIAAMKARIWITQGRLTETADWARERGVTATDEVSYLHEFHHCCSDARAREPGHRRGGCPRSSRLFTPRPGIHALTDHVQHQRVHLLDPGGLLRR